MKEIARLQHAKAAGSIAAATEAVSPDRMHRILVRVGAPLCRAMILWLFPALCGWAAPLQVTRPAAQPGVDSRYEYYWEILAQSLKATEPDFGPFVLKQSASVLDEQRALEDLEAGGASIDILVHGNVRDYETRLLPVRFPLDEGLLGYRVFLIRADLQPLFDRVNSLDDLRAYSIGQGRNWGDIQILRNAGLKVVEGGDYGGLFKMLAAGRFDLFSRSVTEVQEELSSNHSLAPALSIERHLLLYYTLTRYFYVARTPAGEVLARRVSTGLERMLQNGSFQRLFESYKAGIEKPLGLRSRVLIRIDNPLLTAETPLQRRELWYDPFAGVDDAVPALK